MDKIKMNLTNRKKCNNELLNWKIHFYKSYKGPLPKYLFLSLHNIRLLLFFGVFDLCEILM